MAKDVEFLYSQTVCVADNEKEGNKTIQVSEGQVVTISDDKVADDLIKNKMAKAAK